MSRLGDADPSFRRAVAITAVLLSILYLIFSGVLSHLAPLGSWKNLIFGQPAWSEWDPAGTYVDSAHQLVWGDGQLFEGHPGTPLILLLSAVQHGYYAVAGAGTGFTFTEFTARHLPTVFILSKLMMTMLHLAACFVTFLFARRLLRDERAAAFAALGYATSLPVLYYLSRISVEPLVVIFFGLSLLAIWRYQDLAREERLAPALGFAALSATAAVSGVVTKLSFMAPLLPLLALYIALGGWRESSGVLVPWRTRGVALLIVAGVAAGLGLLYSQLIDWNVFFRSWMRIAEPRATPPWTFAKLLPGFSPHRAFLLCELVYLGVSAAGWFVFLRRNPEQRMRTLAVSALGAWGVLLFAFNARQLGSLLPFHYFHLTNVVAAAFFGHAVTLVLRRLSLLDAGWLTVGCGLLGVAFVHAVTVVAVVDSRIRDAAYYEPNRQIHRLIAGLEPGQRLACIGCVQYERTRVTVFDGFYSLSTVGLTTGIRPEAKSRLAGEFDSLFVPMRAADLDPRARRIEVADLRGAVVVVGSAEARATTPVGQGRPIEGRR